METRLTDRKRAAIIEAAAQEFSRTGFYSASMSRIAELADVSKRTLYKHFASKDDLFDAIVAELVAQVEQVPFKDYDPNRELEEQFQDLARTEMKLMSSVPVQALARAGLSRVIADPEIARSIDHQRFLQHIIRWLKQAKSAGELSKMTDVQLAADQLVGLLKAFAFWPPLVRGEAPPTAYRQTKIVKETTNMFLARYQS